MVIMQALKKLRLDALQVGAVGTVLSVEGDDEISKRLVDLGFWPGTSISVVRCAPFGDPIQLRLRGYRLALRRAEAARIVVTPKPE